MKTYTGNVEITKDNAKEWEAKLKGVEKITGYCNINSSATLKADALKAIGGDCNINSSATLPALKTIGGYCYINSSATLKADALKAIGGYCHINSSATLKADALTKVGGTVTGDIKNNITHNPPPIRRVFEEEGFLLCDGLITKIISKRKAGEIVLWTTQKLGLNKTVYVAQKGELFSHGETVKQAVHDLRYKITDRDTSKYKGWTLDSVHLIEDVIGAYRCITGACETGTKMFCEGKDIPAKMSVNAAIAATKGAWGADKFEQFFNK